MGLPFRTLVSMPETPEVPADAPVCSSAPNSVGAMRCNAVPGASESQERHKFGHRLFRRLVDEPMARTLDDDTSHVIRDQPALLDEEFAGRLLTGEYQHRHRQLGFREDGEILRVLLERLEVLEPGTHPARLCICGCV